MICHLCYFHCSASVFKHAVSPCIHAVTINKRAQCLEVCSHPAMKKDKGQTQTYSWKIILLHRTISVWEMLVSGTLLTVYHPIVVDRVWEQTLFSQALLSHGVLVEHDDDLWWWHTGSTVQPNLFCVQFFFFFDLEDYRASLPWRQMCHRTSVLSLGCYEHAENNQRP